MRNALQAIFIITLGLSVVGGIVFVLLQIGGLIPGNLEYLKALNANLKPVIVVTCSLAAIASFLMHYFEKDASEEQVEQA